MEEVIVQLDGGAEFPAEIVGYDHSTDIAVLKINTDRKLAFATLANSDNLKVGDIVFAVGNPLGVGMTVTMELCRQPENPNLESCEKKVLTKTSFRLTHQSTEVTQGVHY